MNSTLYLHTVVDKPLKITVGSHGYAPSACHTLEVRQGSITVTLFFPHRAALEAFKSAVDSALAKYVPEPQPEYPPSSTKVLYE